MRTISVRLDEGNEARLDSLCQALSLSQSEVLKPGLALPQQQSTSPAALAERSAPSEAESSAQAGTADRAAAISRFLVARALKTF